MTKKIFLDANYSLTRKCFLFFVFRWLRCQSLRYMGAFSASSPARRGCISRGNSRQNDGSKRTAREQQPSAGDCDIDVAANTVWHITQVSCDAYCNEIISHVTQTDAAQAPVDEHVAPPPAATYAATTAPATVTEYAAPVLSDFFGPPVPVVQVVQVVQVQIIKKKKRCDSGFFIWSRYPNC